MGLDIEREAAGPACLEVGERVEQQRAAEAAAPLAPATASEET